jgi:O-methyltransferase
MTSGAIRGTAQIARWTPPGCFVEVGVYKGGSAWFLAEVARSRGSKLHLFDTFSGIPFADSKDDNGVGDFGDTSVNEVRALIPDAVFHVGVFPLTLPDDLNNIAFVHCDCDQYQSVRSVIRRLWPRMVPGGIMVFDDMDTAGGNRAITEAFGDRMHLTVGRWYARKELAQSKGAA